MNYIKQINAFWELERERGDFTAHLQSFFFALLYFANKFDKNEFSLYREDVIDQAKLGKDTYYKVRELAQEAGLIEFEEGANKRSKCLFRVCLLYENQDNTQTEARTTARTTGKTISRHEADTAPDHTPKPTNLQTLNPKGGVDAAASPPEEKEPGSPKGKTSKKGKPPGCAAPPKLDEPSHQAFVDAFWQWYEKTVGMPPKLLEADYAALKKIRRYFTDAKKGDAEKALASWRYILDNWAKLEDFLQKQMRPAEIDRNMANILAQIRSYHQNVTKNASNKSNSSKQPAGETAEQAAARYRPYNPNKPAKATG